ncbi:MAG: hypothetical protein QGH94_11150 [Phycisphaerae bacterium]|nr:hypothetical protein [Phycisphaerae bacterium]
MRYLRGIICCWLIASAPLLGMTGFAENAFLCWGSDGYVGIETQACKTTSQSPCFSSERDDHDDHDEHPGSALCDHDDACGSCIDIPLPSGEALSRLVSTGGGLNPSAVAILPAPSTTLVVTGPQTANAHWPGAPPGGDAAIASLRTVVLLT